MIREKNPLGCGQKVGGSVLVAYPSGPSPLLFNLTCAQVVVRVLFLSFALFASCSPRTQEPETTVFFEEKKGRYQKPTNYKATVDVKWGK